MTTKGFTKINNSLLFDSGLSHGAIVVYAQLQYFSTIKNFKINREHIKKVSGYGETAFRRVWKELKDKGLLVVNKIREKGRYVYEYVLKTNIQVKSTTASQEKQSKPVDSDGKSPLDNQISIEDIFKKNEDFDKDIEQDLSVDENVKAVSKATGFSETQSSELLNLATKNITKVINAHVYVISQENVKNIFKYTKWILQNYDSIFKNKSHIRYSSVTNRSKSRFCDFKQRNYDFDKLKKALIYGESYELPV